MNTAREKLETSSFEDLSRILFASGKVRQCPDTTELLIKNDIVLLQAYFITKSILKGRKERALWDYLRKEKGRRELIGYVNELAKSEKERRGLLKKLIELTNKRLLVSENITREKLYKASKKRFNYPQNLFRFVVVPTHRCNYRCDYCFARGNLQADVASELSWAHFRKALRFFYRNIDTETVPQISFFGGEPMLRLDFVRKAVREIRLLERKRLSQTTASTIGIFTNGSLLDDKAVKWMRDNKVSTTISLDGPERSNDRFRRFRDGKEGTFRQTMRGIGLFDRHGVPGCICVTIGKHNLDTVLGDVKWIVKNIGWDLVFNFMQDFLSADNPHALRESDYRKLIDTLNDIYDYLDAKGISEVGYKDAVEYFLNDRPKLRHCSACGGQIVIEPGGFVRACHHLVGSNGPAIDIDHIEGIFDSKLWKRWSTRESYSLRPSVSNCRFRFICGGGCPLESAIEGNSLRNCASIACHLSQLFIERGAAIYHYLHRSEKCS